MRRQIASEFRKLVTTRSAYALLAGLVAIITLGVVAVTTDGPASRFSGPLHEQDFLNLVLSIAPLFALLLGLRSFTDEFRYGSIVPTLLVNPARLRVFAAKVVAAVVVGIGFVLIAAAVSIAVGVPVLAGRGAEVSWSAGPMADLIGRVAGATALWSTIGVAIGLAVRHQVAAIAGSLIWLVAAEGVLGGLIPDVARYFPGSAGWGIVGIGDGVSPAFGAVLLGGYALAAVVAGGALAQRRDVT